MTGERHIIEGFTEMVDFKGVGFIYGLEQGKEESDTDFAIRIAEAEQSSTTLYYGGKNAR